MTAAGSITSSTRSSTPGLRAVSLCGFVRSLASITGLPSDARVASWSRPVSAAASSHRIDPRNTGDASTRRSSSVDPAERIAAT
jgi:hypothetical protein